MPTTTNTEYMLKAHASSYTAIDANNNDWVIPADIDWSQEEGTGVKFLPNPAKYTFNLADMDSETTARNTKGKLNRSVVTSKRSLNVEWGPLTNAELKKIYDAIKVTPGTKNTYFFVLEYPDPAEYTAQTGIYSHRLFYCGDRSSPAYTYDKTTGEMRWTGLTVNFIER